VELQVYQFARAGKFWRKDGWRIAGVTVVTAESFGKSHNPWRGWVGELAAHGA
jgi:hypothetical protein